MAILNESKIIKTLDYHTAGEPLRIVTQGCPEIVGDTMLEKRQYMKTHHDDLRRFLMLEPRGHADMYGAVLTKPVSADGDTGVLFLHNEGYSTMCGHAIIALVHAAIEQHVFPIADPDAIRIDTPAGQIRARANFNSDGQLESASFLNVPSFVLESDLVLELDGLKLELTIAYGGAFYAYVDANLFQLDLIPSEAPRLIELGRKIKQLVCDSYDIRHPQGDDDLNFLYGVIFVKPGETIQHSRNVCIFADGELDRSPTGTGVSGRAAIHWSRGEIAIGDELCIESILGTAFKVRCVETTMLGTVQAVIPEVTGSASITGEHCFMIDPRDPLSAGFLVR